MNRAEGIGTDLQSARVGGLIRARRHSMRMTLQTLGAQAGVSVGYLSQVERNQANPSLSTLASIAQVLGLGVDYFVAAPKTQDAHSRAGERMRFSVGDSLISYERLHAEFPGNQLSSFLISIEAGYRSEPANHEGEEIIYLLEGALTLSIENQTMIVSAGDSLHFRGNRTHSWANETETAVKLLWSGTLTMFRSSHDGSAFQGMGTLGQQRSAPEGS